MAKRNLVLFGVDSLRADHMSCYGYGRLTTPHIDRLATQGVLFKRNYSPHIPTTSAYASMLTGMDCFSTQVVALRHMGGLLKDVVSLPEMLRELTVGLGRCLLRGSVRPVSHHLRSGPVRALGASLCAVQGECGEQVHHGMLRTNR